MDKQILDLLTEMNNELKSVKSDIHSLKLEGAGGQLTNESRNKEIDFIVGKVYKLEKEIYFLRNGNSN